MSEKSSMLSLDRGLVLSSSFRYFNSEEFDTSSVHDFYVKVLRGRARIKARRRKRYKEYTVIPLSDHLVLGVEYVNLYCDSTDCEETRIVMVYEYVKGSWKKTSEYVKEEW